MSLQRIIVPLSLVLAFVATAILACDREPSGRPNVLLVTIDTLRPDRLGAYGYDRIETPNIDRLAAEGALFETALTDTPWTTPSMSSVMTGTYATHHGFKSTNANRLAPRRRSSDPSHSIRSSSSTRASGITTTSSRRRSGRCRGTNSSTSRVSSSRLPTDSASSSSRKR
ncbi:MAG: sulfatase-like hydrolase/transferase [Deltaproteobacteria bacterium]|nr:sulfatase-like hydrolase/transferase [Deltaproteobacteria bacterium]